MTNTRSRRDRPRSPTAMMFVLTVCLLSGTSCRRETGVRAGGKEADESRQTADRSCLRVIRGKTTGFIDDPGIDFDVLLVAPPGFTLGYMNDAGTFMPSPIAGDTPSGILTFFPGTCFSPALRQDATGKVEEADRRGMVLPLGEPVPPAQALDPLPAGPYHRRVKVLFHSFADTLSATLDAAWADDPVRAPLAVGNGVEIHQIDDGGN